MSLFIIGAFSDDSGTAKTTVTGSATQTGGSKDASLPSHTHTATSTVTDPQHNHTPQTLGSAQAGSDNGGAPVDASTGYGTGRTSSVTSSSSTGITVATSNSTEGVSATNANLVPYYALAFTGLINDQVIAAAGMKRIWGDVAEGWFIAKNDVWNYPITIAKAVKQNIDTLYTDCGFSYVDIAAAEWVNVTLDNATFRIDIYQPECDDDPSTLQWINQFGSWDSFIFRHNVERKGEVTERTYTKKFGAWDGTTFTYDLNLRTILVPIDAARS